MLTSLNASERTIKNLEGIEALKALTSLVLIGNQIRDLGPLAGLTNLTSLDLGANQIRDLGPLAGLTNLTTLDLGANQISDLDPLAELTNLTTLDLSSNQISALDPLSGLGSLTTLFLRSNNISDLDPLAALNRLSRLFLNGNPDIDVLTLIALKNAGIDVAHDNLPPAITSQPDSTATEGVEYMFTIEVVDVNEDDLTFSLTTFPQGMAIDGDTGNIRWTPSGTQAGNHPVTVLVFDGEVGTTQTFEILVEDANLPPTITSQPGTDAREGEEYVYTIRATDVDGDTLTFSLTTFPQGMAIDSTGTIRWTPSGTQDGNHPVTALVFAGEDGVTQPFEILIEDVNLPPTITSQPGTDAREGDPYVYTIRATDVDGDELTFRLSNPPEGMNIDSTAGIVRWTPSTVQAGTHPIVVEVHAGPWKMSQEFEIQVENVDLPPKFTFTPVPLSEENKVISIDANIIDDIKVLNPTLHYRPGGGTEFLPVGMLLKEGTSDLYQASIPGDSVTSRGIEYFIEAADIDDGAPRQVYSDTFSVSILALNSQGVQKSAPQPDNVYRLVSVPLGRVQRESPVRAGGRPEPPRPERVAFLPVQSGTTGAAGRTDRRQRRYRLLADESGPCLLAHRQRRGPQDRHRPPVCPSISPALFPSSSSPVGTTSARRSTFLYPAPNSAWPAEPNQLCRPIKGGL